MKHKLFALRKGFTLMEMVVVVLIISILSATALSIYVLSAEQSRMSEAELWIGSVLLSQQRRRMSSGGKYARYWRSLDIAKLDQHQEKYANSDVLCPKDKEQPTDGNCRANGYKYTLHGVTSSDSGVVAQRVNSGKYSYKLAQFYDKEQKKIYCVKGELYPENDEQMCAVFLGVDEYDPTDEEKVARIEAADVVSDDDEED